MAITVLMKKRTLQKAISVMMVIAALIVLYGLWLQIHDSPDATIAFVTGGVVLLFGFINRWWINVWRERN